ncbi:hypothetical protein AURDEDRAFT_166666 [Auricularia subglabra TFB-10046 SS5]|nr:hypothetical protein AURDEDRAFT_166666 [Auricularia subglabra TFB-10046 SS5]
MALAVARAWLLDNLTSYFTLLRPFRFVLAAGLACVAWIARTVLRPLLAAMLVLPAGPVLVTIALAAVAHARLNVRRQGPGGPDDFTPPASPHFPAPPPGAFPGPPSFADGPPPFSDGQPPRFPGGAPQFPDSFPQPPFSLPKGFPGSGKFPIFAAKGDDSDKSSSDSKSSKGSDDSGNKNEKDSSSDDGDSKGSGSSGKEDSGDDDDKSSSSSDKGKSSSSSSSSSKGGSSKSKSSDDSESSSEKKDDSSDSSDSNNSGSNSSGSNSGSKENSGSSKDGKPSSGSSTSDSRGRGPTATDDGGPVIPTRFGGDDTTSEAPAGETSTSDAPSSTRSASSKSRSSTSSSAASTSSSEFVLSPPTSLSSGRPPQRSFPLAAAGVIGAISSFLVVSAIIWGLWLGLRRRSKRERQREHPTMEHGPRDSLGWDFGPAKPPPSDVESASARILTLPSFPSMTITDSTRQSEGVPFWLRAAELDVPYQMPLARSQYAFLNAHAQREPVPAKQRETRPASWFLMANVRASFRQVRACLPD